MIFNAVLIGDTEVDGNDSAAVIEAGAALLLDERSVDMSFDGRPLSNREMHAGILAENWSPRVRAIRWCKSFEQLLEDKISGNSNPNA